MTINITITADNAVLAQEEMRVLLNGSTGAVGTTNFTPSGPIAETAEQPRMTAAQKKAAEKAAKEAAEAAAKAAQQAISTGEERVDPAADKQDAKDEAAEKAAEPVKLTHDSVRAVLGGYVQAYGMAAAQEDGAKLIKIAKISEIPDDQAALAAAVIAIATGIEKNPHKRDIAGDGITAEKLAELKPIVAAAVAVK